MHAIHARIAYRAFVFAYVVPAFSVLRGALKIPLIVMFMRAIAVLAPTLTPHWALVVLPGLLLYRALAAQKFSGVSMPGIGIGL